MGISKKEQKELIKKRIDELEKRRGYLSYGEVMTLNRLKREYLQL